MDTDGVASTPGALGYARAVLVAYVLVTGTSGCVLASSDPPTFADVLDAESWMLVAALAPVWAAFVALACVLSAPIGVLVVHLVCERFDSQWFHVLISGVTAGAACLLVVRWTDVGTTGLQALAAFGVAGCAAIGRTVVTPMVPVVIERFPEGTPYWGRLSLR